MSPPNPSNLEELLVELGSQEVPGETEHRYTLRRALLNSHLFDEPSRATMFWSQLVRLRAPLLAGGIAVSAFVIVFTLNSSGGIESGAVFAGNEAASMPVPVLVRSQPSTQTVSAPSVMEPRRLPTATLASSTAGGVPASELFQSFHQFASTTP